VQYGVEEALDAGLYEVGFVTGRGKRAINDHFDTNYELEKEIAGTGKEELLNGIRDVINRGTFSTTRQRKMAGLGNAILTGKTLIGDEAFGVVLADDLCFGEGSGVLSQMVELYNQFRCTIVAIEEVPDDQIEKFGVIAGDPIRDDLFRVTNMVEKPPRDQAPSNLAIIGRYILTPDIFDIISDTPPGKNGEVQITDALLTQAKRGAVMAYKFKGKRYDCGSIKGFIDATNYCYENIYSGEG
ncbi:MAG: UTP--glucose-1-phosphate uridylyltransferase, partial [Pseudomonadales bacterium]|nr:UTP--glucose-1-phosphate uridylyltransferase [Pseudomonadales bacterium]